MTTSTGSISLSGLLGGTAGQIDTTTLISNLMAAQSVPQSQLQDQLTTVQSKLSSYQTINAKLAAVQTAAQALTDPTAWQATAVTSSSTAVAATSSTSATPGTTTFSVTQLAQAQVTTVAADSSGAVISVPSSGITVTDSTGQAHTLSLASGSAADVATAINAANLGVRASVIQTNSGVILQVTSTKTGSANGFSLSGTDNAPTNVVTAQDAQVTVGDTSAGGYVVSSSSNTFSTLIKGVTFSANALANNVTLTVASDPSAIATKVQALVTAANAAKTEITTDTAKGAVLQSQYDALSLNSALASAVSAGVPGGGSLATYGIDLDSSGQFSFDSDAFTAAYNADPSATQAAVSGGFAASLASTAGGATAPVTGAITAAIAAQTATSSTLTDEISTWTDRLATIKDGLTAKFGAMETALAKLQSQQTYLTSMFDSLTKSSDSSSS
ncbi:flagellar filament capping protein FliD [uncultured Jatrophihabitans sp.]|uniref:flagellar filament capping protein FliD n=1 Tax=uncultured Jatrophihabitans sp. TaxID=1610747 RepID=UPI0035CB1436